jgi:hypothetical protein
MIAGDVLQPVSDVVEGDVPVYLAPLAALLDHGLGQTVVGIEGLVGEALLVGNPALVDRLVLPGQNAQHGIVLDLDDQVCANGIVGAHRLAALQFPGAGGIAERLGGQGADRAQVDHVARQLGINRAAEEGLDLGMHVAVGHAEFHDAGDFLPEAHAAGTVDAAAHFLHADQGADVLVEDDALFLGVAALHRTVADGHVLQLAFAALVADGAVQGVVDEEELHHTLLGLHRQFGMGEHLHPVGDRGGTSREGLRRLLHLHQAHAAVGGNGEFLVVAEMRNVHPHLLRGIHHRAAVGHLRLFAVDLDF